MQIDKNRHNRTIANL